MVPSQKILEVAKEKKVDIIGLSGLITPSLDEMVQVASEMERLNLNLPLLIGGATTSKVHTAIKIEPKYSKSSIYIPDASKSVDVVRKLLSKESDNFQNDVKNEYKKLRLSRKSTNKVKYLPILEARKNKFSIDWASYTPPKPRVMKEIILEKFDLNEIVPFIDWTPFFLTWELKAKFPEVLKHKKYAYF